MNFKHVWAFAQKDLRIFKSDKKAAMISLVVPIFIATFMSFVFASPPKGDVSKTKVLIVDEDQSETSKAILAKLQKSDLVEPTVVSATEAEEKVKKGDFGSAAILPKGFGEQAAKALFAPDAKQPAIQVLFDPSKSMDRQVLQGALMECVMSSVTKVGMTGPQAQSNLDVAAALATDPARKAAFQSLKKDLAGIGSSADGNGMGDMRQPFTVSSKAATASTDANAETDGTRAHVFAGMAVQGMMFFAIDAAMGILRDKRTGVWARIKSSPVANGSILAGRGLGSTLICALILSGVLAFGMLVMHFHVMGSWLGLILVGMLAAMMVATFGLFVASLGATEQQARGFSVLAVLSMSMLGGAWMPVQFMPKAMQAISTFIPVRWAVEGIDAMMWRGGTLTDATKPIIGLLVFSALFFGVAAVRMKRD